MSDNQALAATYYVKHVAIISVFCGLASVAVILRVWARRIQKTSLDLSDHLIFFGLLCALGGSAVNIYGCCFGTAKPMSQKDVLKAAIFSLKSQFMSILIWVTSVTSIRASIIFLYIHIFFTPRFRRICYSVLVINLFFFIGTVLADCLICQPISYRWDRFIGGTGSCGNQKSLDLFLGIFNLFLDVTAVVLPMPVLWGLKMNVRNKVMLSGMFGMGIVICALTIYRIYVTSTIIASNAQEAYATLALLTTLEALLGVINACLPVLKPAFKKMGGTASKSGFGSGVREIVTSGTIPIFMRVSQMFSLTSRKRESFSGDGVNLTENSRWSDQGKKKKTEQHGEADAEGGKGARVTARDISPPMTDKAERVMGIKAYEIHVRSDVDVESVVSRN